MYLENIILDMLLFVVYGKGLMQCGMIVTDALPDEMLLASLPGIITIPSCNRWMTRAGMFFFWLYLCYLLYIYVVIYLVLCVRSQVGMTLVQLPYMKCIKLTNMSII